MTPLIAVVVGAAGAALTAARCLPQLHRLLSTRRADGVSLSSLAVGAVSGAGWASYSVLADLPSVAIAATAACCIFSACLLVARRLSSSRVGSGPALWAGTLLLVQVALGTQALGLALAASAIATGLPQLREVRRRTDLSGVSSMTWTLAIVEGALWLGVGLATMDAPVLVWAVGQLVVGVPVLAAVRRWRPLPGAQPSHPPSPAVSEPTTVAPPVPGRHLEEMCP